MPEPSPVDALSREYFEVSTQADPLVATMLGVPGVEDRLPDLSEAGQAQTAVRLLDLAARAEAVDPEPLDDADRVTRAVLAHSARQSATLLTDAYTEFALSAFVAPVGIVLSRLPKTSLDSTSAQADYVSRLEALPTMLAQASDRALGGLARGRTPARSGVEQLAGQLRSVLSLALDDDPLLAPAAGTPEADRVRALLADKVRPAFAGYLETLAGPMLESARGDERCGIVHLPDGPEVYARAVAMHTTTSRTPEDIHQLGLDLCAALRDEYAELGQRVFGVSDFAAVTARLREDPDLRYGTAQEMLDDAREALVRAEQVVGDWFGELSTTACTVEPMSELEAPTGVMAYYRPPASDGSRPGQHWLNTHLPETRPRYEYETLAYHESVPGHHFQFARAQQLTELPDFRRYLYVTAFGEGWGLYTERLADEMGLYSSDLARFGMLSFDSWRACRLVVDTGMHYYGWSRQQAIDFMLANSALTPGNIANEVDRYIAWPGQALAYMIGRQEILGLRRTAQERLGPRFDIRGFHDAVLGNGSVPLPVLADEVERWITRV